MDISLYGRISYEIGGTGPLVVCIPGMGDVSSTYRFLTPAVIEAGYRVAIIELRGHGTSTGDFDSYDDTGNAADVAALIAHLGAPAVIVGNSMGAAISVLIAAAHPELIAGLILVSPFVRNGKVNPLLKLVMRAATSRPLVAAVWNAYLPSLFAGQKPSDFAKYRRLVASSYTS
ncbi:MAG: alpha/beta fold hydrolase [Rhodoglobus sp.]